MPPRSATNGEIGAQGPQLLALFAISIVLPAAAMWLAFKQPKLSRLIVGRRPNRFHLTVLGLGLVLPFALISLAFAFDWDATGRWLLGAYGLMFMLQILGTRIMLNMLRMAEDKIASP